MLFWHNKILGSVNPIVIYFIVILMLLVVYSMMLINTINKTKHPIDYSSWAVFLYKRPLCY